MSDYADYVKEREGHSVIETNLGFIEYSVALPFLLIHSIYVKPEFRRSRAGSDFADRVTLIAQEAGATHLWAQVWVSMLNSTDSLRAILGYGFSVQGADGGRIILTKEIGDQDGEK